MSSGSSSSAQPNGSSSARHRDHQQGRQDREYTKEQKAAVERIRTCRTTAYYEILAVEKTATDVQIKKAYHKLSLATHPDKNGAPGADDAFKLVSKAFQVLSDPQKRTIFDQTGSDPEARAAPSGGGGGGNPFAGAGFGGGGFPAGFGRASAGGPFGTFESEMTPEDLLNMMFGAGFGGGMGGPFQGGGFTFGGPGIRVHQFGGAGPRARRRAGTQERAGGRGEPAEEAGADAPASLMKILIQLLPLLIFFLLPALTSLFFGDGAPPKGPAFSIYPDPPYTFLRETPNYKIPYYVNANDFKDMSKRDATLFEKRTETAIVSALNTACAREEHERAQALQAAEGWFGPDQEKRQRALKMPMPNCRRVDELKIKRSRNY